MALITDSWMVDIMLTLSFLLIALYFYLKYKYNYWKARNVPFAKPKLFFGSNMETILGKKSHAEIIAELYKQFEGERFCGFYQFLIPTLMIRDPELIDRVLIKDFSYFENRALNWEIENDPLSINLVTLTGEKWRGLRHKLTPTFTTGKLKGMFAQMINCGEEFLNTVEKYAKTREEVDTKLLTVMYSSEVISSCAFGLQIGSNTPEGKRFTDMVNKISGNSFFTIVRIIIRTFFPRFANLLRIKSVPSDVNEYFINITKATMDHRIKNNIYREDFFQLLITLKQQDEAGIQAHLSTNDIEQEDIQLQFTKKIAPKENIFKFTDEMVAAQSFVFFSGGSESVSSSISIVLYYLAEYPDVQKKLQTEVDSVMCKHGGQWTYEALKDMTYLDQVIQESQRLFPIAHLHLRVCNSAYKIPDSDVVIEEGTTVIIPSSCLQRDPNYYPDPDVFDPDRFANNNFKPSPMFSPFGDGPRICIAMRFAVLEMKVYLARLMSKYSMKPSSKTLRPLRYDPRASTGRVVGGIWVSFQSRSS